MLSFILSFSLRILKHNSEILRRIESQSSLVEKATTSNAAHEISALLSSPSPTSVLVKHVSSTDVFCLYYNGQTIYHVQNCFSLCIL